ncbi:hypothetical protein HYX00_02755 [Candidatus Woesearchaeota archaeon]|nr:hypothetical protein [Candidatus Woesearchaeota archaeon]
MTQVKGTIEDLIEVLDDVRREIPAKKDLTEEEIRSRLEDRAYGILKVVDRNQLLGLWRLV